MAKARARLRGAIATRQAARPARRRMSILDYLTAGPLPMAAIASIAVIALTVLLVAVPLSPFAPEPIPPVIPDAPGTTSPTPDSPIPPTTTPTVEPDEPDSPGPDDIVVAATPDEDGNFVFYLSDAPNDIGDFESLTVTIESIDLKPQGGGSWVSIVPIVAQSDLVQLQGDLAHELWRGNVPEGDYAAVFLRISTITGILASSGAEAVVTLPSDKLHVTSDFSVGGSAAIEFVFDITVHATGGASEPARYVLQPQAEESGTGRSIVAVRPDLPAGNAPGVQQGPAGEPAQGDAPHPNDDAPKPVEPPGPGQGLGPSRPRYIGDILVTP